MGRLFAVEVVYRGFPKNLSKRITRAIVLAAHKEGKPGISFWALWRQPGAQRHSREGLRHRGTTILRSKRAWPSTNPGSGREHLRDDTLCKAWSLGLVWVAADNRLTKPNGTLIVTRARAEALVAMCHRKETPYKLAIVRPYPVIQDLGFQG